MKTRRVRAFSRLGLVLQTCDFHMNRFAVQLRAQGVKCGPIPELDCETSNAGGANIATVSSDTTPFAPTLSDLGLTRTTKPS